MKRRLIGTFLSLMLCITFLPGSVLAAEGEKILPKEYKTVEYLDKGLYSFTVQYSGGTRFGVIDSHGKVIIEPLYCAVSGVSIDAGVLLAAMPTGNSGPSEAYELWGAFDLFGKAVLPCVYEALTPFSGGYALARRHGSHYCIIDSMGSEIEIGRDLGFYGPGFGEGAAWLNNGTVIDYTGKVLFSPKGYTGVQLDSFFKEGLLVVQNDKGLCGFLDRTGAEVIACKYENAGSFSGGLAPAKTGGKYGYIDKTGDFVIPPEYTLAESFIGEYAAVRMADKNGVERWHCINRKGEVIAEMGAQWQPSDYTGFSEGYFCAQVDSFSTIINESGRTVLMTEGIASVRCSEGAFIAEIPYAIAGRDARALIDTEGRTLTPLKYCVLGPLYEGHTIAFDGTSYRSIAVPPSGELPAFWAQSAIGKLKTQIPVPQFLLSGFTDTIRRDEFTALVINVYEYYRGAVMLTEPRASYFNDIETSLYSDHVRKAKQLGIVDGIGNEAFGPAGTLTREQAAKILYNLVTAISPATLPEVNKTGFLDDSAISRWAVPYVEYCSLTGMMEGVGGERFAPNQTLDRQTALTAIWKTVSSYITQ